MHRQDSDISISKRVKSNARGNFFSEKSDFNSFATKYSKPDECFSSFSLYNSSGSALSSSAPSSARENALLANATVHFPNQTVLGALPPEGLDQLWVAGFLDRSMRDPAAMQRRRLRKMLAKIPEKVKMKAKGKEDNGHGQVYEGSN